MIPHNIPYPRWLIAALVAAGILAILAGVSAQLLAPADRQGPVREIVIPEGVGAAEVARILEREGIVRYRVGFSMYATLTGKAGSLQAGRYLLCPCSPVPDIVSAIAGGDAISDDIRLTVPEGTNIWGLDALLLRLGITSLAGEFSGAYEEYEGHLFPETYLLPKTVTAAEVATRMTEEFFDRAVDYTPEQVVIASILEKEAKTPRDMSLVAGIIYERLERGMALQVDATVAYGWCVRTSGYDRPCDVTQAPIATEIKLDGPYNTYTRVGLPSDPISNPGAQALEAATYPKTSDYLFYLSTRDGSQLIYSRTLDEHLRNRAEYLGF